MRLKRLYIIRYKAQLPLPFSVGSFAVCGHTDWDVGADWLGCVGRLTGMCGHTAHDSSPSATAECPPADHPPMDKQALWNILTFCKSYSLPFPTIMTKNRLCNHQGINRLRRGLWKVPFCIVKGHVLMCKRASFEVQKGVDWKVRRKEIDK